MNATIKPAPSVPRVTFNNLWSSEVRAAKAERSRWEDSIRMCAITIADPNFSTLAAHARPEWLAVAKQRTDIVGGCGDADVVAAEVGRMLDICRRAGAVSLLERSAEADLVSLLQALVTAGDKSLTALLASRGLLAD